MDRKNLKYKLFYWSFWITQDRF